MALADYLGITSTSPEQWARLAQHRGLPPELSEVTLFTPRAAAPTHDTKDAPEAIAKGIEAAREAARPPQGERRSQAPAYRGRTQGWWGRR